jgi:hypothetical protein
LSWVKSTIFGADPNLRCFYLHPCLFVVETCFIFRQFPCFLKIGSTPPIQSVSFMLPVKVAVDKPT